MTVRCGRHDLGTPDKLARGVAVGEQNLKFSTVGGAKVKADVFASHAPSMAHQAALGNLMSDGEDWEEEKNSNETFRDQDANCPSRTFSST